MDYPKSIIPAEYEGLKMVYIVIARPLKDITVIFVNIYLRLILPKGQQ